MTMSMSMSASQHGPGTPISIQCRITASDGNVDSLPNTRLATTTTASVPATFGALAHSDVMELDTAAWDLASDTTTYGYGGGVATPAPESRTYQVLKRIDSNYAAGKYLWFLGFGSATPGGSDAPTLHAGPYLIV